LEDSKSKLGKLYRKDIIEVIQSRWELTLDDISAHLKACGVEKNISKASIQRGATEWSDLYEHFFNIDNKASIAYVNGEKKENLLTCLYNELYHRNCREARLIIDMRKRDPPRSYNEIVKELLHSSKKGEAPREDKILKNIANENINVSQESSKHVIINETSKKPNDHEGSQLEDEDDDESSLDKEASYINQLKETEEAMFIALSQLPLTTNPDRIDTLYDCLKILRDKHNDIKEKIFQQNETERTRSL